MRHPALILHVIATLDPAGAESQMVSLVAGLDRRRFAPSVAVLQRGGERLAGLLAEAGVPWRLIGKGFKCDPGAVWRLARHIRAVGPDVVHTWLFTANAFGRAAALAARVPVVVASERVVDPGKPRLKLLIDRCLAAGTDLIVANSPSIVDFYVRRSGIDAVKFAVVPNGVEVPDLDRAECRRRLLAEPWARGLEPGAALVGAVGRLAFQKGLDVLLEAMPLVLERRGDAVLVLAGDGEERSALEERSRRLGIERRVFFLGHRADAAALIAGLDLLVLPSRFEGLPNSLLEAQGLGTPVVASAVDGVADVVADGRTGVTCRPGDAPDLGRAVIETLATPERSADMARRARAQVLARFGRRAMIDAYERIYERLLGQVRRGRSRRGG